MMIPIPKKGTLKEILGLQEAESVSGIEEIKITIPISQKVVPLPEGNKYLGFIFSRSEKPEEVEETLKKAHERLEFVIE
ncbi:biotin carboxylase, partial [candidate division KSB1 bacterium]|nr:biotin carboxylase [candidate division KSB1 bacterium]